MKKHGRYERSILGLIGLLIMNTLAGCSGGGDGGGAGAQAGVVSVSLTDAPACGYEQVNVTVSKVRIHQSDSANENAAGWTDITLNPPQTIDLLSLNDPTQPNVALHSLGETSLPAGHYTQLRLVLEGNNGNSANANSIVLAGQNPNESAKQNSLETPSAIQSGIKLINQFTVNSGERVDLLLDFDACKSIVQTGSGKYKLKPVIKVIPIVLNGIEGFIQTALLGNNVIVSAQVNGEILRAAVPNPTTGKFLLARLDPRNYDVVITADGHATSVISGVPVASATSITPISTSGAPFALTPSTPPRTISGNVTLTPETDDVTVFVAAKQSLNAGPMVTVKSRPTALLEVNPQIQGDSTYSLAPLPPGAPALGAFGPLPHHTLCGAAIRSCREVCGSRVSDWLRNPIL